MGYFCFKLNKNLSRVAFKKGGHNIGAMMEVILAAAGLSMITAVGGILYCLHYKVAGFWMYSSEMFLLNLLFTSMVCGMAAMDWLVTISVVFVIIIHTTGTGSWQVHMIKEW